MARPAIELDMDQLSELMRFTPRLVDAAAFFKCSPDTIERRIRDETGLSFAEFREQNTVRTRKSLVQKALQKAEDGDNVMLIFCLKNLCGWKDKQELEQVAKVEVEHLRKVSDFDLKERIKQLLEGGAGKLPERHEA